MPLISKSKNNISPENNRLKLTTTENNKENIKREINLSANIKKKNHIQKKKKTQKNKKIQKI